MLEIVYSTQFKKDLKKVRKLPLPDLRAVFEMIQALEKQQRLQEKYKDHCPSDHYIDFRECHIKPDLLLVYQTSFVELKLIRIDSPPHSELF
ncbi:plasmid stabilization system protein [Abyssogena phaseoliformis symbiont OG214]|uniref:type II toxin-antitoxin system RelE/ParE family toxin n=1 Tax=Abyssogena phaseoliformis symbiont TaxID=596095 RepID=UPI0019164544|nr:type II toxin-antitoxin system YafQ family toxin [Abyssogena phaseoliformis symbiont]MBW5289343.1 YafQ toxin protein [Candidatus Ruthia sp. Apha_13_S6]BBB22634.1 plasmid stabilization system protein [Abyssogena phaseoliformis symbiont OG214]